MTETPEISPELSAEITSFRWIALILAVIWVVVVPIDLLVLPSYSEAFGWGLFLKAGVDSGLASVAALFGYAVYRLGVCAEKLRAGDGASLPDPPVPA